MRQIALALVALAVAGCDRGLDVALTQEIEAQRLAADMRVQLHRSAEAVQRAIMADGDEASAGFSREAQEASGALEADLRAIEPILADAGYREEADLVQEFAGAFGRLQDLDRVLLSLAVENSNVKAQRLSFGPAREAADALRDHVERAAQSVPGGLRAQLLAARPARRARDPSTP